MCAKHWGLAIFFWLYAGNAFAAPTIEHWVADNGTRVYFVETHELPMFEVELVFDAGSVRDPAAKHGLAALTARMLNEGAGELDVEAIARRFEAVGAEFGASSEREMASLSLRSLSDRSYRQPAVELFAAIAGRPTFPEASLTRERSRALVGLEQLKQSPGDLAAKTLMERVYGAHPYAAYPDGDEAGLTSIARADLVDFHRRFYVGANAVLAIVGDLSKNQARRLVARLLANVPRGEKAAPLPEVPPLASAAEVKQSYPSTQSHVLLGAPGMARNDPDYFPLFVGNFILGGSGLISRLSQEIREKQGLSYSVYSYFSPLRQRGPFVMGLQTKNAERARATQLMRATLARFMDEGPSEEELAAAKRNLTGGFPLRIDSNRKIADYLVAIGFYQLPLDYLDKFIPSVQAVTREQIMAAFRRRIDPTRLVAVVVGG